MKKRIILFPIFLVVFLIALLGWLLCCALDNQRGKEEKQWNAQNVTIEYTS